MIEDPKRLSEELGELGEALVAAKKQLPSAERLLGIAERLAQVGVVLPEAQAGEALRVPEPTGGGLAPAAEGLGSAAKALLGVVGIGGVVLGVALATRPPKEAPSPSKEHVVVPGVSSTPRAPDPTTPENEAPRAAQPKPDASAVSRPAESVEPAPPRLPQVVESAPRVNAPSNERAAPPTSAPNADEARAPRPEPSSSMLAPPLEKNAASRASARSGTLDVESPPESEVELLKRARSTATSDPAQSLAISARHRAEFPNGAFAEERELLVITALLRLGRTGEANARAAAFRSRYPRSAYLVQLERMFGAR